MKLCFNKELLEVLTPEEIIYISLCVEEDRGGDLMTVDVSEFYNSSAYFKLLDYYANEMPYGTAKCRTGEPDVWILNRIRDIA